MISLISQLSKLETGFQNSENHVGFKSEMIQKIYQAYKFQLTYSNLDLIGRQKLKTVKLKQRKIKKLV